MINIVLTDGDDARRSFQNVVTIEPAELLKSDYAATFANELFNGWRRGLSFSEAADQAHMQTNARIAASPEMQTEAILGLSHALYQKNPAMGEALKNWYIAGLPEIVGTLPSSDWRLIVT